MKSTTVAVAAATTLELRFAAGVTAKQGKEAAWEALLASDGRKECPEALRRAWEHVEEDSGQGNIRRAEEGLDMLRIAGADTRPLVGWIEACEAYEEARVPRVERGGDSAALEGAIVAALREKGEAVVEYSTHYGVEVYLTASGVILESDPDVEGGAFIAPREAVKTWGQGLIRRAGFVRGEVYAWTTSWRGTNGPVLEEFACRTQYWAAVPAALAEKVAAGETLSVGEGLAIAHALMAAEEAAVLKGWKEGLRGLELGGLIESAAGLSSLYPRPMAWTGQLAREMREFGLIARGWKLFSQNGSFQRLENKTKLFRGYQTGSGWCAEIRVTPDFALERLAPGNGYTLSLWLMRPVQL